MKYEVEIPEGRTCNFPGTDKLCIFARYDSEDCEYYCALISPEFPGLKENGEAGRILKHDRILKHEKCPAYLGEALRNAKKE